MSQPDPASEQLRYPIGRFRAPGPATPAMRQQWIEEIRRFPADLRAVVEPLQPAQLELRYRLGGWSVRQLAHHLPDSHVTAFLRIKMALTAESPAITPYDEDAWARLPDVAATPIATSLNLLDAVHQRWSALLAGLEPVAFTRSYHHPEWGAVSVDQALAQYTWHGRHHLAHIHNALKTARA